MYVGRGRDAGGMSRRRAGLATPRGSPQASHPARALIHLRPCLLSCPRPRAVLPNSHTLDGITMNEDDGGRVAQHQVVDERKVRQRCGRRRDQRQLGQALHERGNEVRRQEAANKSHICVPPPAPSMCAYL